MSSTSRSEIVLVALLFVLLAQVARTMFPQVIVLGEDWSYLYAGLFSVAVFAAPILAWPIASLGRRRLLVAGTVVMIAARVALQLLHPISSWLSMTATAAALLGATLAILGQPRGRRGAVLALGVMLGLALDTALRAPFRSWDLAWQDGAAAAVLTTGLVAAAAIALTVTLRLPSRAPQDRGPPRLLAVGPFLTLQLLFLQNLGYVGSQAEIGFAGATLVVLAADAAGLCVLALLRTASPSRSFVRIGAIIAAALAASVAVVDGVGAIGLVVALQALATALVGLALRDVRVGDASGRTVWSSLTASLTFAILTFLWLIDIDAPLPFPRALVPAAAAALLGVAASRSRARTTAASSDLPAFGLAAIVGIAAVALSAWLWFDRPASTVRVLEGDLLRIVQYNVRGALNTDGQLDPDAVARAIASSNPDVVVLQEVARGWPVFGAGDLLARLGQRLDMPSRFEPAADGQFGNAILSRLPITPIAAGPLPDVPDAQRRSFLMVRIDVGTGRSVEVVGTHLETDAPSQIRALLATWGGASPAVIAGDMNMQPDDTANVALFTGAGLVDAEGATGDPCRTTSAEPTSECDRVSWVWLTQDLEIVGFRIGTVAASDHLPVHVSVTVPRG